MDVKIDLTLQKSWSSIWWIWSVIKLFSVPLSPVLHHRRVNGDCPCFLHNAIFQQYFEYWLQCILYFCEWIVIWETHGHVDLCLYFSEGLALQYSNMTSRDIILHLSWRAVDADATDAGVSSHHIQSDFRLDPRILESNGPTYSEKWLFSIVVNGLHFI